MTRECHTNRPQIDPWYRGEDTQNTDSYTYRHQEHKVKQPAHSLHKILAKLERTPRTTP